MQLIGVQKIILEDGVAQELNYRFVHPSPNVTYSERLDSFYTNPDAQILSRNILEFNEGHVSKAGPDLNLDGEMDVVNRFTYSDGDLVRIQLGDGSEKNFSYSTLYDNFNRIDERTYGVKIRRLLCAEQYAGTFWPDNLGHSIHLLADEPNTEYQLTPESVFYKKKITPTPLDDGAENEAVTEFFFTQ